MESLKNEDNEIFGSLVQKNASFIYIDIVDLLSENEISHQIDRYIY